MASYAGTAMARPLEIVESFVVPCHTTDDAPKHFYAFFLHHERPVAYPRCCDLDWFGTGNEVVLNLPSDEAKIGVTPNGCRCGSRRRTRHWSSSSIRTRGGIRSTFARSSCMYARSYSTARPLWSMVTRYERATARWSRSRRSLGPRCGLSARR